MAQWEIAAALVVVATGFACARGSVVYDGITGHNTSFVIYAESEYAEDATLSTGAMTPIRQVEVGIIKNPAYVGTYSGTMTVHLYADSANGPGVLLGTALVPVAVTDTQTHVFAASFTDVIAPTATIWIGSTFSYINQYGAGQTLTQSLPSVGSSAGRIAYITNGQWFVNEGQLQHGMFRINSVPTPGAAVALAGGVCVLVGRRRRV